MREVEVLSFHPSAEPLFSVIFSPRSSKRRKTLTVVGTVLTKITTLEFASPASHFTLSPAFIYKNDVVLGQAFWDPDKDGGEITVTPAKRRNKARKSCST